MPASNCRIGTCLLTWALLVSDAPAEDVLRLGETITTVLTGADPVIGGHGPSRCFTLVAETTGPLTVSVESYDFDAFLRIENEHGEVIAEDDNGGISTNAQATIEATEGTRYSVLVTGSADAAGEFTLAIHAGHPERLPEAAHNDAAAACHDRGARRARAQGDTRALAHHLVEKGEYHLRNLQISAAKECYMEALAVASTSGNQRLVAYALSGMGRVEAYGGHLLVALEFYKASLSIYCELRDLRGHATSCINIGEVHFGLADYRRAQAFAEKALRCIPRGSDHQEIWIDANLVLGAAHRMRGHHDQSRQILEKALEQAGQDGAHLKFAEVLTELAQCLGHLGRFAEARNRLHEALAIVRAHGDSALEQAVHFTLGRVCVDQRDWLGAKQHAERCIELARSLGSDVSHGAALDLLADALMRLGDLSRARRCAEEALFLARLRGSPYSEYLSLRQIAYADFFLGDLASARACREKEIVLARKALAPRDEARSLQSLGIVHAELGEVEKARSFYRRSMVLALEIGEVGFYVAGLTFLGYSYGDSDPRRSLLCMERALCLAQNLGLSTFEGSLLARMAELRVHRGEVAEAWNHSKRALGSAVERNHYLDAISALTGIARCCQRCGRLEECRVVALKAEQMIDSRILPGEQGLGGDWRRSGLFNLGRVLQDLGARLSGAEDRAGPERGMHRVEAFSANGRWKGRSLLHGFVDRREGHRSAESLRLRKSRRQCLERRDEVLCTLGKAVRERKSLDEIDRIRERLTALSDEAERLEDLEREGGSAQPRPKSRSEWSLEDIRSLLPKPALLVDYSEGDSQLYGYVLSWEGLTMHDLGGHREIYADARAFAALVSSHPGAAEAREVLDDLGHSLYHVLLAPLLKEVGDGVEYLVISPTPELAALPFEALIIQPGNRSGRDPSSSGPEYVLDRFEVAYAPSVQVLLEIDAMGSRKDGRFLVLADPLYASESPHPKAEPDPIREEIRTWRMAPDPREFERLERSRLEALAVAKALSRGSLRDASTLAELTEARSAKLDGPEIDLYLGAEASRKRLLDNPSQYRVIHVAAHGILDRRVPKRSAIALAYEEGETGFVSLEEVTELDLDASLVVLSACNTARGEVVLGDGVQSLACAFIYAGARSVVATLWKVADSETASLMEAFYLGYLERGLPPSRALREAKLALRRMGNRPPRGVSREETDRGAHPFFWAPFVYIGLPR